MTRAEQALLLQLFRWARTEGVRLDGAMRWGSPPPHRWGIDFWKGLDDRDLFVWREGRVVGTNYPVASITEAVDLLVTLGIVPARFSTAYRAGYNAANQARQIAGEPFRGGKGWQCPEVYALLPAVDTELVVGQ